MKFTQLMQLLFTNQLEFRQPFVKREPTPEEVLQTMERNWVNTKNLLLEGRDLRTFLDGTPTDVKAANLDMLLDNARMELLQQEKAQALHSQASNTASMNKIILPVIRRAFADLLTHELVGVQAIGAAVGTIHVLQVRPPDDNSRQSIHIVKEVAESKTRKLTARWTFGTFETASTPAPSRIARGVGKVVDVEAEIMAALSLELRAEVDQEFLRYLRQLAGEPATVFDMASSGGQEAAFVGDVHAGLAIQINRQANRIAIELLRGTGNKAVVSPTALTILLSASTSAFQRSTDGRRPFVGTLNNAMNVYVDEYANDSAPVLVAYKGNEMDAGVFYVPRHFLTTSGVVIDPTTFEPIIGFLTRYGLVENKNPEAYFKTVGINVDTLTFH